MSILIVEDNTISATLLESALRRAGFQTTCASSAMMALECLEGMDKVRLIISDLVMPEMDGIELLQAVRKTPQFAELPFIMCTGLADAEHVKAAAALGCKHYLVKPIRPNELIRRVKDILGTPGAVMAPVDRIMKQLDIDWSEFKGITTAFFALVESQMAILNSANEESGETAPPLDFGSLFEGAEIFGADRLLTHLPRPSGSDAPDSTDPNSGGPSPLLAEMSALLKHLDSVLHEG